MFTCMGEVQCKLSCPGLIRTINSISLQLKSANRKADDSWTNWQPIDWAADCDYWGSLGRKPVPGANCPVGLFGAQSTTNCSSFREAQINPQLATKLTLTHGKSPWTEMKMRTLWQNSPFFKPYTTFSTRCSLGYPLFYPAAFLSTRINKSETICPEVNKVYPHACTAKKPRLL